MDRGVLVDRTEAEHTAVAELFNRYKAEVLPQKKDVVRVESRLKLLSLHFSSLAELIVHSFRAAYRAPRKAPKQSGALQAQKYRFKR